MAAGEYTRGEKPPKAHRFSDPIKLRSAFNTAQTRRGPMTAWKLILAQYERQSYRTPQGQTKPCFGRLRDKVDRSLDVYIDFATGREYWAKVTCLDQDEEGKLSPEEKATLIRTAFQKYCINTWQKRAYTIASAAKEMLLYRHGVLQFENRDTVYPGYFPTANFLPAPGSTQFPEEWDLMFWEKRFTAHELAEKAEKSGWDRSAVMALIQGSAEGRDNNRLDVSFDQVRSGDMAWQDEDRPYDIVFALYRESGGGYSMFGFPAHGPNEKSQKTGNIQPGEGKREKFLLRVVDTADPPEECFFLLTNTIEHEYWAATSFAELLYTTCKQYDVSTNEMLECAVDSVRVWVRSSSTEVQKKIQKMRQGSWIVMDPEMKVVGDRVARPIKDLMDSLRMIMVDMNSGLGHYQSGEQDGLSGGPKTATQTTVDLQEHIKTSAAHLALFNTFMTPVIRQIYRRFVKHGGKNKERFEKFLKARGLDKSDWDPENLLIESVINLGAGSRAAKMQAGRVILDTLAWPAQSEGEQAAKREIISAVAGPENLEAYMPEGDALEATPEDVLIGLENEALAVPGASPNNIPVLASQQHSRHVQRHMADMEDDLASAQAIFENRAAMGPDMEASNVHEAIRQLIGVGNKGAHTEAHIKLMSRAGANQAKSRVKGARAKLGELGKLQDRLQSQIDQYIEAKIKGGGGPEDEHQQKLRHKQEEHDLDMAHKAEKLASDTRHTVTKNAQDRVQKSADAALKTNLELERAAATEASEAPTQGQNGSNS